MNFGWLSLCVSLWLLKSLSLAAADSLDPQCNDQCVDLLSPLMDHLQQLRELSDTNGELKDMVNTRELANKDLKSQLTIAERDLGSQERVLTAQTDEIKYQAQVIAFKDDKIQTLTKDFNEVKDKLEIVNRHLKSQDATISDLTKQLNNQNEQLKDQNKLINQVNSLTQREKSLEGRLASAMSTNDLKEKALERKDEQIKKQNQQISIKENQISGLDRQVKSIDEKLDEVTDELLKANGTDRCPTNKPSGIYKIKPSGLKHFAVPCNTTGWMTIQKRFNGSVDFNRSWQEYRNGFGDINGEFFLGLEKVHQMTSAVPHELYIRLGTVYGATSFIHYDNFQIGSESESYMLKSLGVHYGPAGDSLKYHLHDKFSTYDRDNDLARGNCAVDHAGGWWYKACCISTLNGKFYSKGVKGNGPHGIQWASWQNYDYDLSLTLSEMMIRPKSAKN
ncbi:fibrinogen-like protein 1 [Drosophila takahashii]|uniref:fibrinogen-like protein 1 n=1 Tax=Drosophila takahashii TaxID=29030 RepID=UPI001CF8A898|nr:fibrinogen-like protein 1 [Drosophila takahashii]